MDLYLESIPIEFAHILRGVCILVGPFCMILLARLAFLKSLPKHRRFTFAGVFFLTSSGIYTQVERWNLPVTPRLFLVTPGILLLFWGLLTMRKYNTEDV